MSALTPVSGEAIKDFVDSLEQFSPTVPDELTAHTLRTTGFECEDTRTLRLVSLSAQRFIASILDAAINVHKRRRLAPAAQLRAEGHDPRDKRAVLNTEDLTEALKECGINARPAVYFADADAKREDAA